MSPGLSHTEHWASSGWGERGGLSGPPPHQVLPTWDPSLQGERGSSTQSWWPQPARTHLHGLSHVLRTEEPAGLHGLEAAAGSSAGEVVEAGAAVHPARDGGPHPPTVFTFLKAEEPSGVRDAARGQAEAPPPSATRSPVRSLRKQLYPHQPAPPPPAPHQRTRLRTSGGPSSALWGGGVRDKGGSPSQVGHPGKRDGDPNIATALTCRLKELRRSHPLGEADLCQVIPCHFQLWGGLARTLRGLVARQPLRPVGRWLKALQLLLPVRAPVPTVAESAAVCRCARGKRGCQGHTGAPHQLHPTSRAPPSSPAGLGRSLRLRAPRLRPRGGSFRRFQGVPLRAAHLL